MYFTTIKEKWGGGGCAICNSTESNYSFSIPHGGFCTKIQMVRKQKKKQAFPRGINREGIITSARSSINFKEYENACKVFCFVLFYPAFLVMIGEAEYKQTSSKAFKKTRLIIG